MISPRIDLTKSVEQHLPWVEAWSRGEYLPTPDELRLMRFIAETVADRKVQRMELWTYRLLRCIRVMSFLCGLLLVWSLVEMLGWVETLW